MSRTATAGRSAPKRVEVVGLPGAGKSYAFDAVLRSGAGVDRRSLLLQTLKTKSSVRSTRLMATVVPNQLIERHAYQLFYRSSDANRSFFRFAANHPDLHAAVTDMTFGAPVPTARTWSLFQKHGLVHALYEFLVGAAGLVPPRNSAG